MEKKPLKEPTKREVFITSIVLLLISLGLLFGVYYYYLKPYVVKDITITSDTSFNITLDREFEGNFEAIFYMKLKDKESSIKLFGKGEFKNENSTYGTTCETFKIKMYTHQKCDYFTISDNNKFEKVSITLIKKGFFGKKNIKIEYK
jgi:hypothetical protein